MPSGRTIVDGLWQCLCPSSTKLPQKGVDAISPAGARSLIQYRKVQHPQTHTQSFRTKPRIGPQLLRQLVNLQAQRFTHWKPFLVGHHVGDLARVRSLDIASSYQELRRSTLKGDYTHIRDVVEILVKERGQKPNLRLYDALLLANTDSQKGSAGEVARIIDEIAMEGLIPDSTTYHAALRVSGRARGARYALAYTI